MNLDKEVAEWLTAKGFIRDDLANLEWFKHENGKRYHIDQTTATLFYTATKQAELKSRIDENKYMFELNIDVDTSPSYKRGFHDAFHQIFESKTRRLGQLEARLNQNKLEKGYKDEK